jgi:hypothetical protein
MMLNVFNNIPLADYMAFSAGLLPFGFKGLLYYIRRLFQVLTMPGWRNW